MTTHVTAHTYALVNPATGEPAGEAPDLDPVEIDRRVEAARRAVRGPWRDTTPLERAELLHRLAAAVRDEVESLAQAETATNGKPLSQTRGEIRKAADVLAYAATLTSHLSGRTIPIGGDRYAFTFEEPIGVVAALVPWNSPLIIAAMMAGPALAAGCPVLVKPSPITPHEALRLAELARDVGFPEGVLQTITGPDDRASRQLVEHPDVAKVAFTGSTHVGREIARTAAGRFASVLLELGGKSPIGIFDDADLTKAAAGVGDGIILSAGQSCVTPSRLLVQEQIADEFMALVRAHLASVRVGMPLDPATQVGPLSSVAHAERVSGMVRRALADGGELTVSVPGDGGLPPPDLASSRSR
jgi:acyl-CoA reductase-like NAD-dependent aldehyde dehydrogenase